MEFVENPFEFAKKMPVVAPGAQASESHLKTWQTVDEEVFKGVPGRLRVIAGDLTDRGAYAQLEIDYNNVAGKIAGGWMAIYYLPWLANCSVRTTLRPRSTTTREGNAKDKIITKLGNISDYQVNPDDPDIFFTAAVDGCMVSVTGPTDEPTVFHSNAKDFDTETEVGKEDDARIPKMNQDLNNFMAQQPKRLRNSNSPSVDPKAATAFQYMSDPQTQNITTPTQLSPTERITFKKKMGTVFGRRDEEGQWKFFFEKLLKYDLHQYADQQNRVLILGCIPYRYTTTEWGPGGYRFRHDVPPQEFWPAGNGHVLF